MVNQVYSMVDLHFDHACVINSCADETRNNENSHYKRLRYKRLRHSKRRMPSVVPAFFRSLEEQMRVANSPLQWMHRMQGFVILLGKTLRMYAHPASNTSYQVVANIINLTYNCMSMLSHLVWIDCGCP